MKKTKLFLLLLMMLMFSLCCSAKEDYVRVGLSFGKSAVKSASFSFSSGFQAGYINEQGSFTPAMFFASNAVRAESTSAGTFKIFDSESGGALFEWQKGKEAVICPSGSDRVSAYTVYSGIKYPYYIILSSNSDGSFNVINYVETEQYIKGVLPGEVYPSWHEEALKAAAVATRTFTYQSRGGKHKANGVDLCKSTCCQVYSGISKCTATTNKATDDTKGQVLLYNGKLITAVYHAISGGITESAAGAWGSSAALYPYLTVVETPFEDYSSLSNGKWSKFITDKELSALVASSSYKNKISTNIKSITVNDSTPGYLNNVTLTDTSGASVELKTSSQVRSFFSKYAISANFTLERKYLPTDSGQTTAVISADGAYTTSPDKAVYYLTADGKKSAAGASGGYLLDGKGYGHGVGLSQYGSQFAAKAGYTYTEILGIYYPGTVIADYSALN